MSVSGSFASACRGASLPITRPWAIRGVDPWANGRVFQCEPCRQIVIFFEVSDTSPYLAAKLDSVQAPAYRS